MTLDRPYDLLLLDFGGVCLLNPVELHPRAEAALGLPPGTFEWMGPVDPTTDPLWQELLAGDLSERDYWARRAVDVGAAAGIELDVKAYMGMLYDPPDPSLIRAGCTEVVARAREARLDVSVLTNDLAAFHGPEWARGIPFLQEIDHLVDCSETNILKPDPRAYARALEITGHPAERALFVDDQPANVAGAVANGIDTVSFDVAHPDVSWAEVADRLNLGP